MGALRKEKVVRRALLPLLGAVVVALAAPGVASAAQLWFPPDFDPYPKTFGPNATVEIGGTISFKNDCAEGINDRFAAFADVYIVPTGSVSNGSELKDVSAFDTVGPAAGGGFFESVIGFTKPSGAIPGGTYDIVYDECQDGKFDLFDSVFGPALIVDVPTAAVPDITGSIQAAKNAAGLEALPWLALLVTVEAVEIMQKTKAVMECLQSGGIAGCAVAFLVNKLQDYVKEQFYKAFMTTDPNEAAKIYVQNHIKKYAAIFLDPPDPSFLTPSVVLLPPTLYSSSGDPLQAAQVAVGNAAGTEAALADAFLRAIERYQGADAASEGDAALMQARAVQEYAFLLRQQTVRTSASLDDLVAAYAADTRPFEDVAPELETLRAQLEADGFSNDQRRLLLNLGASEADITALAADIAADSYAGFSEAALAAQVESIKDANAQVAAGLADTVTGMSSIIAALVSDPVTLADAPIADAAGPYSGATGTAIALDGSGSAVYPGRTIASYAWDLDGDGAFDDASGVAPDATFTTAGHRVVGLQITDSDGKTGIAYASVTVTATNAAPVISVSSPLLDDLELDAGDSITFSVGAVDADGDALTIRWLVNGVEAATGPSFTYSAATAGVRIVAAQVSDGKPDGLAEREWGVSVLAPDADGDGWNANVDCADDDAAVNPDHREVVGNGTDDDCDATTPDTGSAPVAQFSQTVSPGLVVAFTDASTDVNDDIATWAWNFGDGSTSADPSPTHTYAVKGTYTVTLSVEDATGNTHAVTKSVVVASAPTASFTYLPPSPVGGSEVEFTDTSDDSDGTIQSWAWTFGDGGTSAEQHPKHVYLGPGSFDVTLTVTDDDGATGSATQTIAIGVAAPGTAPLALFRPDVPGQDVAALANGGTVTAYSSAYDSNHVPAAMLDDVVGLPWAVCVAGPHFATIQISSGAARMIDSIALMPRADGYFDQRVRGFAIDVSTTGTAAADFTQVLATTAADNSELQTFPLPPNTTAKYVRYRPISSRGSSCISTSKFKVLTSSSGPRRVTFLNQSTNAATYKWTFGDGSTSTDASPTHTYATVGTYTVTLTAKSADGRTSTVSRAYEARGPTADFSVQPGEPEPGVPAVFRDTSLYPSAPGRTFAWSFGDGTTSTSSGTLHTFATAGAYTVTYTVTDAEGSTDSVTRTVTVAAPAADAAPIAYFNPPVGPENRGRNLALAPDGATVAAFSGQYDANSYPVTNLIDGNPASNPWLTPNGVSTGWVTVKLSSTGPRMIDRVRLQPRWPNQAVKGFELEVSTSGADESSFVTVLAASAANNESLQTFALPYPMPATHLRYRILSNHAGGNYTATGDLRVDTGQESTGLTIGFRNLSRNATSYAWNFGDGSASTDAEPVHTYAAAGTYPVTLTATNANGSATFTLEQIVRTAAISYSPAAPDAQQQIDFVDATPAEIGLRSWSWSFGDGSTSALQHPFKTYSAPGTYTVTMTGTDREGAQHVATRTVVVAAPAFRAQFHPRGTFNMASLENGAAVVSFSSQYDGSTWKASNLLDGYANTGWASGNTNLSKTITFSLAGSRTYQIDRFQLLGRLDAGDQHPRDFEIAVSTTGTADADFKTVLRATLPAGQTTPQTFMLPRPVLAKYVIYRALNNRGSTCCVTTAMLKALSGQVGPPTVTFDDLSVGGVAPLAYAWDFGDGTTSSEASPTHTFAGPGTYDVTLTVTDATGAVSSYALPQRVVGSATPAIASSPAVPNEGQQATFTDTGPAVADAPVVERRWIWGDGTSDTVVTAASTTHAFYGPTQPRTVRLRVTDAWGQTSETTKTVTFTNLPPTVSLQVDQLDPASVDWLKPAGANFTFSATVADPGNDALTCAWAYGDGTTGTGCSFSHTYAAPGSYTATITVTDVDGAIATATSRIHAFAAGAPLSLTPISTPFNSPIGIDYHEPTNSVVISANYYSGGQPYNFERINLDGSHTPFSNFSGLTDEVKIATVRSGTCQGGFTTGELFVGTGVPGVIARLAADGSSIQNPWVRLPGENGLMRGGLFQDRFCAMGGDLVAVTTTGGVWRINSSGVMTRLAALGKHLEGVTTVPDDAVKYGPWAGKVLTGAEGTGETITIAADGTVRNFRLGINPEDFDLIEPNANFFGVNFGSGRILGAPASQFLDKVGDILITQEFASLWSVRWNNDAGLFEPSLLAQTAQWEHVTMAGAGIKEIPPANRPPVATDVVATTGRDTPVTATLTATDPDSDTLAYSVVSPPGDGSVTLAGAQFTYTPASGFVGTDTFMFRARDGSLDSNVATVTITVSETDPCLEPAPNPGGIFVTGHDSDFHAVHENPLGAQNIIRRSLAYVTRATPAPRVLYVTGTVSKGGGYTDGRLGLTAAGVTFDTAHAAAAAGGVLDLRTVSFAAYDAIVVASDFGGWLGQAEIDELALRKLDLFRFINRGGGLVVFPESQLVRRLSFLPFDLGTLTLNFAEVGVNLTSTGQAIGLVPTDVNGNFSHAVFTKVDGLDAVDLTANREILSVATRGRAVGANGLCSPPDNRAPVADDRSLTVTEGGSGAVTLVATDVDADPLVYSIVDSPGNGTLTGTGALRTYTPAPGFDGIDSFTYVANDGTIDSNVATVTITVTNVNDAPVAADLDVATPEDTPRPIVLPATDPDGDSLTLTYTQPADGSFDGTLYTPNPNYNGPDSFTYTATDPDGASDTGIVSISVAPVNDVPVAGDDAYTIDEDTTLTIPAPGLLANDSDLDGDSLSTVLGALPARGALTYAPDGSFQYTPDPDSFGLDSFSYDANDGNGGSDTATVTITVRPVDDAPVAGDQSVATDEDTPLAITLGATDADGDSLIYALATAPLHGTWDGTTYTPAANYNGPDSFDFLVSDGNGPGDVGTVSITVRPVNDAPAVDDRTVATDEDTPLPIALDGSDIDGDALTFTTTAPGHGTYAGGVYTPAPNYSGPDSFDYTATDAGGASDTATVTITVRPVNDPPDAQDLAIETDEDTTVTVGFAGTDPEGDALTFAVASPPAHGSLAGNTYTPAADYNGPDSFTYTADDGNGGRDTATVTITVRPVNDPPTVTLAGPAVTDEGAAPVTFTATAVDPDGGSGLSYSWAAGTGTLTPATATAGYENDDGPRTDTVTVTVSDGSASASAAASIAVRNVAPNASAGPDVTEFWGLPIVFTGSATDPSDADTAAGFAAQWAFGDGTLPVAGLAVGHVYAQPGAYTATFGATDKDGGSDADTTAVAIGKRPTAVVYGGPTSAVYGLRTLSATLVDEVDEPTADIAGRTLVFRLGTRTFSALTNAAGVATVTSVLPLTSGTVVVEFAGDGRYLPSSTNAELTILAGPGKITGGGLRSLNHPGRGGFNVHSASKGELQWQNGTLNFHAPELTALGVALDGRTAWFAGIGRDGRAYVAYVEDNGEPGRSDVFKLWIAGVLQTPGDGKLSGGNIQIHK